VDFIYENLGNFGGHAAEIQWAKSVEDLRVAYGSYLDKYVGALYPLFRVPIRFTFWAYSYDDGSTRGWIPENEQDSYDSWNDKYRWGGYSQQILGGKTNPKYPPNFREQVKMIEAMMPMLGERDYIKEIVSEYKHWKVLSFHTFNPDNVIDYFQVFTGDLQGKPGFQAYKLWASMLDPNDRLAYRHVLEPRPESKIVIGDKQFITDSGIDWSDVPYVAAAAEGYAPLTYWGNDGQEDISASQHWDLPGHDLEGIRSTFKSGNLAVRWETYKPDIKAGFTFELRFNSPGNPDATVYIDVNPRDKRAEVQLQTGGKNYYLESSIAAFVIEPSQTALYLKDIKLPETLGSLHDLQNWRLSSFVIFPGDSGNEYYNIPIVYDKCTQEPKVSAAEETMPAQATQGTSSSSEQEFTLPDPNTPPILYGDDYPGPDEQLYQPEPDEQIWLTDLDGHGDIYDNDSIKINYAPGFDVSQITKIDVYRNGIKLRFVPQKIDVLTNAQMKTFDGNPAERSPASNHTDHAIMGYEYEFKISTADPPVGHEEDGEERVQVAAEGSVGADGDQLGLESDRWVGSRQSHSISSISEK